jgi:hypothetical protein
VSDSNLNVMIETLFNGESSNDRVHAQVEIQSQGLTVLRPLLKGLVNYIKIIVKSGHSPHPQADTPYQQLTFGYLRMIQNIFITWEIGKQPLIETLETVLADSEPSVRALALVCLSSPLPSWVENEDRSRQIRANIQTCQTDENPVVRAAARFASDQTDQIKYAIEHKHGDGALRQRLEKSAFEVIQGIARS